MQMILITIILVQRLICKYILQKIHKTLRTNAGAFQNADLVL